MRRSVIFVLAAVVISTPAWAFNLTQTNADCATREVTIGWANNGSTPATSAIAIALTLTITSPSSGVIFANPPLVPGSYSADGTGYGIYPGSIGPCIYGGACPISWGTPVEPPTLPGAENSGPGTKKLVIAMARLSTVLSSGNLFRVKVTGTGAPVIHVEPEILHRGGVVSETAATMSVAPIDIAFTGCVDYCILSSHPRYPEWVAVGRPTCWCYPRQCYGDADGYKDGGSKSGYYYCGSDDLNTLMKCWKILEPTKGPGVSAITYTGLHGQVKCICADFARDKEGGSKSGYYRVGSSDLNALMKCWKILEPTKGPGIPGNCGGTLNPQ